jgi:glutathione S-transferase
MEEIKRKRNMVSQWISQATCKWGPTLANYIKATEEGIFGAFKIKLKNRQELAKQCSEHIERLLEELDRRFAPSPLRKFVCIIRSSLSYHTQE